MADLDNLKKRVTNLEKRNIKVEANKTWELSWTRRLLLVIFTYLSIGFYLNAIKITDPWLNAVVPSLAFLLSTLTFPFFKKVWERYVNKR